MISHSERPKICRRCKRDSAIPKYSSVQYVDRVFFTDSTNNDRIATRRAATKGAFGRSRKIAQVRGARALALPRVPKFRETRLQAFTRAGRKSWPARNQYHAAGFCAAESSSLDSRARARAWTCFPKCPMKGRIGRSSVH